MKKRSLLTKANKMRICAVCVLAIVLLPILGAFVLADEVEKDPCSDFSYKTISSGLTQFVYNDGMLLDDAREFSADLTKASVSLSLAAYNISTLEAALTGSGQMGYTIVGGGRALYNRTDAGVFNCDLATYTIGYKDVQYHGESYGIYCVVLRGTYKSEWFSNFDIGLWGDHDGFYKGAEILYDDLQGLFAADGLGDDNRIIWFTGHSRGAAIANIVAGQMTDAEYYAPQSQVFCYSFACPAVSANLSRSQTHYSNIYCFNNPGDLIPELPPIEWGYERYGYTGLLDLGQKSNFLQQFKREQSADYAGMNDTDSYKNFLFSIVPYEDNMHEPLIKLMFLLVGYAMGGNQEATIVDLISKAGLDVTNAMIMDALHVTSITSAIRNLNNLENRGDSMQDFIDANRDALSTMTDEEFAVFLSDHSGDISTIEKMIGTKIETPRDLLRAYTGISDSFVSNVLTITDAFVAAAELVLDADGEVMDSISHAHEAKTYAIWINSMFYGYRGWYGNTELTEINVTGTRTIGEYCFYNCTSATTAELEDGMALIPQYAFTNCSSLESVILPDTVESIGNYAFSGCTGMKKLQLPISAVYKAGYHGGDYDITSFRNCSGIEELYYTVGDGTIYTPNSSYSISKYCRGTLKTLTFAEGITTLPAYVAYNCTAIKTVLLPASLEKIGQKAFIGCTALQTANFQGDAPACFCGTFPASVKIKCRSDAAGWRTGSEYNAEKNTHCGYALDVINVVKVSGTSMVLGNEIALNIAVKVKGITVDGLTAYVIHHAKSGDITYEYPQTDWTAFGGYYRFSAPVKAVQMTDQVSLEIRDAEGNVYNNAYSTSVRDYVGRVLPDTTNAYSRTLMVDMVNYGAAAQEYFGYQTGDLANANLTEEQKALATEAVTCGDDLIKGANYIGSTLNLKDRILMNVYFKNDGTVDISKLYATVSFTGYKGNEEDHTVAVKSNKNGLYVEVDQIVLGDSFEPVTVTVYNADGTVYGQVTDSVESYVGRNADNNALYMNIIKFAYSGREYMKNK